MNLPLDREPEPLLIFSLARSGLGGKSSLPMPDEPCDDDVFDFFWLADDSCEPMIERFLHLRKYEEKRSMNVKSQISHAFFHFAPSHLNRSKISLRSTHRIIISRWQQQRWSIATQLLLQLGRKRIKELHMSLVNRRRRMLLHILTTALGFSTRSRIAAQRRLESSLDDIDFHVAAVRRRGALNWHIDGPRRRLLKSAHREREEKMDNNHYYERSWKLLLSCECVWFSVKQLHYDSGGLKSRRYKAPEKKTTAVRADYYCAVCCWLNCLLPARE